MHSHSSFSCLSFFFVCLFLLDFLLWFYLESVGQGHRTLPDLYFGIYFSANKIEFERTYAPGGNWSYAPGGNPVFVLTRTAVVFHVSKNRNLIEKIKFLRKIAFNLKNKKKSYTDKRDRVTVGFWHRTIPVAHNIIETRDATATPTSWINTFSFLCHFK